MGNTSVGAALRRFRVARNLTLESLADRSGISVRAVSDIERGVRAAPRERTIVALADALGLLDVDRETLLEARAEADERERADPAMGRPHPLGDFVGRRAEIEALTAAMQQRDGSAAVVVVLSGPPGAGKTSTALETARRSERAGGLPLYVDLGGASPNPLTPVQVLRALLAQLPDHPDAPSDVDAAAVVWAGATADTAVVVVLDDAGAESQVRPVLQAGPGNRILITSRRSLAGLEAADHIAVGPLPREDSVEFLAGAIPEPQRSRADLDELAALCGDLPLALRIAAGRISAQPARRAVDLVDRLRTSPRPLRVLTAGDLRIERTFAASYGLLVSRQRRMFRELALLPAASFSAAAASAARAVAPDDTRDALEDLADLGLVEPLAGGRFRLHALLRLFALDRLEEEEPDAEALLIKVDRWYLRAAAQAGAAHRPEPGSESSRSEGSAGAIEPAAPPVRFDGREQSGAWLRAEVDGWMPALRRAAGSGRHAEVVAAAQQIRFFGDQWLEWGRWREFFTLAAASAEAIGADRAVAQNLADRAYMENFEVFDYRAALATAADAFAAAQRAGDRRLEANALDQQAIARDHLGDVDGAERAWEAALRIFEQTADSTAEVLQVRFTLAHLRGIADPARAEHEFRSILSALDDPTTAISSSWLAALRQLVLTRYAHLLTRTGRAEDAVQLMTAAIATAERRSDIAGAHARRGHARAAMGDRAGALEDFQEALDRAGRHRPQYWADEIVAVMRGLEHGDEVAASGSS